MDIETALQNADAWRADLVPGASGWRATCAALADEVRRLRQGRRELQRDGKHAAPCARYCEAAAFEIDLRKMKTLLRDALPHVAASAEASHLTDGFSRKPQNDTDRLAARIHAVVAEYFGNPSLQPNP